VYDSARSPYLVFGMVPVVCQSHRSAARDDEYALVIAAVVIVSAFGSSLLGIFGSGSVEACPLLQGERYLLYSRPSAHSFFGARRANVYHKHWLYQCRGFATLPRSSRSALRFSRPLEASRWDTRWR